jgi:hypothetical protein
MRHATRELSSNVASVIFADVSIVTYHSSIPDLSSLFIIRWDLISVYKRFMETWIDWYRISNFLGDNHLYFLSLEKSPLIQHLTTVYTCILILIWKKKSAQEGRNAERIALAFLLTG